MPKIKIKGNSFLKRLLITSMLVGHALWLIAIRSQLNSDVIFPAWLLDNSKSLVSEVLTMYPPWMFYVVNFVNNFTNSFLISTTAVQIFLVLTVDSLLFYYLKQRFGFKLALGGLIFYIPWQVFFRGNYLWHDFATIPFILISFFYFEKFVLKQKDHLLFFASSALALGYFFKLTVVYIYLLYLFWVIFIVFKKPGILVKFKNLVLLAAPPFVAILLNFLAAFAKSTFEFSFHWNIIMQMFVYPRLDVLPRSVPLTYFPIFAILLTVFFTGAYIIWQYSKEQNQTKWFLFSFTIVSLLNIFPRWSDFHVQPFLVPLTIICVSALSFYGNVKPKRYFIVIASIVSLLSILVFTNRVITEMGASDAGPGIISKFAPEKERRLIEGRSVFIYDYELYDNKLAFDDGTRPDVLEQTINVITNPEYFHHSKSWQIALNFVKERNPDVILIPYPIQNKMIRGENLIGFEEFVLDYYKTIGDVSEYSVYAKR